MKLTKLQQLIIGIAALFFTFISYHFAKNVFVQIDDQTLFLSHTAIDLYPPLRPLTLKPELELLAHFSAAQVEQALDEKSSLKQWPNNLYKTLKFDGDVLVPDANLRAYLDAWFLLYPTISFLSMRYFMALDINKTDVAGSADAKQRFAQLDKIFIAYVNLLREIEMLPVAQDSDRALQQKFQNIKKLRRSYLGESVADVFYSEQEELTYQQIFSEQPSAE